MPMTRPPAGLRRPGFSLAELMIAVAILGIGLLVISAALPVGLKKTQQIFDQVTGEAANRLAQETIALRVGLRPGLSPVEILTGGRTSPFTGAPYDPAVDEVARESIYRPRFDNFPYVYPDPPGSASPPVSVTCPPGTLAYEVVAVGPSGAQTFEVRDWEPWIKVRPLVTENVIAAGDNVGERISKFVDLVEQQIEEVVADSELGTLPNPLEATEFVPDNRRFEYRWTFSDAQLADSWQPWALPVHEMVYPPVDLANLREEIDGPLDPEDMINDGFERLQLDDGDDLFEAGVRAALGRRFVRTTFYRRVNHDRLEPGSAGGIRRVRGDDRLYEMITVTLRRPTEDHWFPVPDVVNWNSQEPEFDDDVAALLPIPVLVTFTEINWLEDGNDVDDADYWENQNSEGARTLSPGFSPPATLSFRCTDELGQLLPEGSIIIPATNDDVLSLYHHPLFNSSPVPLYLLRVSGLIPHAPGVLPIYRVIEQRLPTGRENDAVITVENPGYYPWTLEEEEDDWPVWVIPPAFSERTGDGAPIFPNESPIVGVHRRMVKLNRMDAPQ